MKYSLLAGLNDFKQVAYSSFLGFLVENLLFLTEIPQRPVNTVLLLDKFMKKQNDLCYNIFVNHRNC